MVKILVVDDEPGIRLGCARVLEPLGFEVVQAETIHEGLARISETLFDMALIDVMLPDGHGMELLEPILERDADTICVIITGYATVELAVQAMKNGAYDFLAKPFDAEVLEHSVRQALEMRRLAMEARRLQGLEAQVKALEQERAERARLDQFKTNFMWMMAHELRSPLSASQSLLRTLLKGAGGVLSETQHECIRRVEGRLGDMQLLVDDLLALAASKSPDSDLHTEKLDVMEMLEIIINKLTPRASEGQVELKLTSPSKHALVLSNRSGLETILTNLLDNAIKYSHPGGHVTIDVYAQNSHVGVRITDTGIGIPAEALEHVGEEFFRAPNARSTNLPGSGLGLSIVNQLLERLAGRLDIQSELDRGTTVNVRLPAA